MFEADSSPGRQSPSLSRRVAAVSLNYRLESNQKAEEDTRRLTRKGQILHEKEFTLKLSGNEVCCTNYLILLVNNMLCSKLHYQQL